MGPNLRKWIKQQNLMREIFGGKLYDTNNLTDEDKQELAQRLSCDLSPEVMTCDGEIRGANLIRKMRFMAMVKKEFEEIGGVVEMY